MVQKLKLNRDDATLESERRGVKDRGQESLTSSRSAPELINNNVNLNVKVDTELLVRNTVSVYIIMLVSERLKKPVGTVKFTYCKVYMYMYCQHSKGCRFCLWK